MINEIITTVPTNKKTPVVAMSVVMRYRRFNDLIRFAYLGRADAISAANTIKAMPMPANRMLWIWATC